MNLIDFIVQNRAMIETSLLGIAFGVSELLAFIPSIKANGIFQGIYSWLSKQEAKK